MNGREARYKKQGQYIRGKILDANMWGFFEITMFGQVHWKERKQWARKPHSGYDPIVVIESRRKVNMVCLKVRIVKIKF